MLSRRAFCLFLFGSLFATSSLARRRRGGRQYNEDDLPPRFRGSGLRRGNSYSGTTMSREELEQCVLQQENIDQLDSELDATKTEISGLEQKVKASESRITKEETLVDPSSQASVDHFNSLLPPHDRLVANYNAKLPHYNRLVEQQKSVIDSFNKTCTVHPYYIDDMVYVLKKLGLYG